MIRHRHHRKLQPQSPVPADTAWNHHLWELKPVKDLIGFAVIILLLWAIYVLRQVLMPVFVALFLAYLCDPLVDKAAAKWNIPRPVSSGIMVAATILAMVAFFWRLGPILVDQAMTLADKLPEYTSSVREKLRLRDTGLSASIQGWFSDLRQDPGQFLRQLAETSGQAIAIAKGVFGAAAYVVICAITIPVLFFVFAWRFNRITAKVAQFVPRHEARTILRIVKKMDNAVAGFFRGRLLISALIAAILSVGWFIVDVPYWFLLAVLTGFLNIIPYASTLSWPIAIILKYIDTVTGGGTPSLLDTFVWPALVFFIAQAIENWVLTPLIQSEQTDLSAATVVVVVLVGGATFGFLGMLFAIPVAACIKILMHELVLPRLYRWAETH